MTTVNASAAHDPILREESTVVLASRGWERHMTHRPRIGFALSPLYKRKTRGQDDVSLEQCKRWRALEGEQVWSVLPSVARSILTGARPSLGHP